MLSGTSEERFAFELKVNKLASLVGSRHLKGNVLKYKRGYDAKSQTVLKMN